MPQVRTSRRDPKAAYNKTFLQESFRLGRSLSRVRRRFGQKPGLMKIESPETRKPRKAGVCVKARRRLRPQVGSKCLRSQASAQSFSSSRIRFWLASSR